jgi:predicted O-methyltransferase YrrM
MNTSEFKYGKLIPENIKDSFSIEKTRNEILEIYSKGVSSTQANVMLYSLVRLLKPKFCIELGTKVGMSAYSICSALKENKLGFLYSLDYNKTFLQTANKILIEKGLREYVKLICSDTIDDRLVSYMKLDKKKIDFLFIDTDHSYEHLKKELLLYKNFMSENGIIVLHDYCDDYPGILKASEEILVAGEWIKLPYSGMFDVGVFQKK